MMRTNPTKLNCKMPASMSSEQDENPSKETNMHQPQGFEGEYSQSSQLITELPGADTAAETTDNLAEASGLYNPRLDAEEFEHEELHLSSSDIDMARAETPAEAIQEQSEATTELFPIIDHDWSQLTFNWDLDNISTTSSQNNMEDVFDSPFIQTDRNAFFNDVSSNDGDDESSEYSDIENASVLNDDQRFILGQDIHDDFDYDRFPMGSLILTSQIIVHESNASGRGTDFASRSEQRRRLLDFFYPDNFDRLYDEEQENRGTLDEDRRLFSEELAIPRRFHHQATEGVLEEIPVREIYGDNRNVTPREQAEDEEWERRFLVVRAENVERLRRQDRVRVGRHEARRQGRQRPINTEPLETAMGRMRFLNFR